MEQDSAWKDVLEILFPEFLEFFFPEIHRDIDFSREFVFLDKELQKILKGNKTGKRVVDKLVKVHLKNGNKKWLLIHVEVQGDSKPGFAKRLYIYNYRIFDKFNWDVVSLAVLADKRADFRENEYRVEHWGFSCHFRFPTIKLLDYADDWEALNASTNPFAQVVKAFLKTLETEKDEQARFHWKREFLLNLYDLGFTRKKIIVLYRFIDWIMTLPAGMDDRILLETIEKEKGERMPYISYAERKGEERGEKRGEKRGLSIGLAEGLHHSIYDILEIKFGDEGLALFEPVKKIDDIEILQTIRNDLKKTADVIEAAAVIKQQSENFEQKKQDDA